MNNYPGMSPERPQVPMDDLFRPQAGVSPLSQELLTPDMQLTQGHNLGRLLGSLPVESSASEHSEAKTSHIPLVPAAQGHPFGQQFDHMRAGRDYGNTSTDPAERSVHQKGIDPKLRRRATAAFAAFAGAALALVISSHTKDPNSAPDSNPQLSSPFYSSAPSFTPERPSSTQTEAPSVASSTKTSSSTPTPTTSKSTISTSASTSTKPSPSATSTPAPTHTKVLPISQPTTTKPTPTTPSPTPQPTTPAEGCAATIDPAHSDWLDIHCAAGALEPVYKTPNADPSNVSFTVSDGYVLQLVSEQNGFAHVNISNADYYIKL